MEASEKTNSKNLILCMNRIFMPILNIDNSFSFPIVRILSDSSELRGGGDGAKGIMFTPVDHLTPSVSSDRQLRST